MKGIRKLWLVVAALALGLMIPSAQAQSFGQPQSFDAIGDFSITSNPNGAWSYGWTASLGSTFTSFTVANPAMCGYAVLDQWTMTAGCPNSPLTRRQP